jgi:shikimate dehydrogenase
MPLKNVAAAAVSSLHGAARVLGVVNTIVFDGQISHGYNTDVTGLMRILRNLPSVGVEASRAVVLGSGASAASALLSLRDVGVEHVTIIARNMKSASLLAHDFNRLHIDVQPLPEQGADSQMIDTFHAASLVVSTLPQPVSAAIAESLEANQRFHNFTSRQAVIELGYGAASPSHSLSALAAGSGARAVDGLEFLIQQGVDQVLLHLGLTEPDSLADVDPGINELIDRLLAAGRRALQTD